MGARIATGKILLIQYGPTMTVDQFKAQFMPDVLGKTIRNKSSRGDIPKLRGEMFDSQEVGDWWDSYCTATAPRAA